MLELEAKAAGYDVRVNYTDTGGWYYNLRVGKYCAAVKILIDNQSNEILGAHMLVSEYAELINMFGRAIKLGLKAASL